MMAPRLARPGEQRPVAGRVTSSITAGPGPEDTRTQVQRHLVVPAAPQCAGLAPASPIRSDRACSMSHVTVFKFPVWNWKRAGRIFRSNTGVNPSRDPGEGPSGWLEPSPWGLATLTGHWGAGNPLGIPGAGGQGGSKIPPGAGESLLKERGGGAPRGTVAAPKGVSGSSGTLWGTKGHQVGGRSGPPIWAS